ncbi:Beta-fructofuranosidase, cell wall isozyme [Hibiscus syriacus]|uniref:Beta-fructofuranosidase, cell wall isozyme n=1 Tax=Hibiscus syriacus TaxID=106335 RepID=A0A6A2ZNJ0_HIBSY|nr:Beta-fructofuranosidase, cell wall isozyme [Hibiscus syriacus]
MADLKLKFTMKKISAVFVICFFCLSFGNGRIQSLSMEQQPYRTAYHFQPPNNWMNDGRTYGTADPNLWGNITWAHSISYDLVNWIHLDNALSPDHLFDINGCWSGSTTFLSGEKPAILYTGSDTMNRQVQNLTEPKNLSDPLLIEWVKSSHNPLMTPVDGIDLKFVRDQTTAWQSPDGLWRVLVGNQMDGHGWGILY